MKDFDDTEELLDNDEQSDDEKLVVPSKKRGRKAKKCSGDSCLEKESEEEVEEACSRKPKKGLLYDDEDDDLDEELSNDEYFGDDEEDENGIPLKKKHTNKSKLYKKIKSESDVHLEACMDTLEENFNNMKFFGTLSEEDSAELKEGVINAVREYMEQNTDAITESVVEAAEEYINDELLPSMQESVDDYINAEVLPSLHEEVNRYTDYVVDEVSTNLMNEEAIVQSPASIQYENFVNKLVDLIESELQIIPEREDALVEANRKIDRLTESVNKANVEKRKIKSELDEAEKAAWILRNTRSLSDNELEEFINECEDIEASDVSGFTRKAKRILESMDFEETAAPMMHESFTFDEPVEEKAKTKKADAFDKWEDIVLQAKNLL